MDLSQNYQALRYLHIGCALLSVSLFIVRGVLMLRVATWHDQRVWRWLPHVIDTVLLASAIALTMTIQQYPFVQTWLTVKICLLLVYIVLGSFALRRGRTRRIRICALIGAVLVVLFLFSVARTHDPLGVFAMLIKR